MGGHCGVMLRGVCGVVFPLHCGIEMVRVHGGSCGAIAFIETLADVTYRLGFVRAECFVAGAHVEGMW